MIKIKKVSIITLTKTAGIFYESQIKYIFNDLIETSVFNVHDGSIENIDEADVYVISTDAFKSPKDCERYISPNKPKVEIKLDFTKENIKTLMNVPEDTIAYFVNFSEKMVRESIARLSQLGVNHINLIPYWPGSDIVSNCKMAITPRESQYVPKDVKTIIDLGHRIPDATTIVELALRLNLDYVLESENFINYSNSIASENYSINQLFDRSLKMESKFELLMGIIDAGIIGVDSKDIVFACNPKANEIFEFRELHVIGHNFNKHLSFLPFSECKNNLKKINNKLIKFKGIDLTVSVTPIIRGSQYLGAFATIQKFTEEETKLHNYRIQLLNKGYSAKYTFNDIIGSSKEIRHACNIARKMAKHNSAVLITGESGTGKELFAHAIHNESNRANHPFIAINCAAMPDNLLESELFGYEEGSFTGAKKGGKLGLFEFAHRGSIFLDEVEGMSPALQIKLLRVIQEKEIMRVGGNKIISVDVRVIAASNEHLEDLVSNGIFRSDLYYRLNTLPIEIPPLRERGDDMMILLEDIKNKLNGNFTLSKEVKAAFKAHDWKGNVRELQNYIEYFTYLDMEYIEYKDLPTTFHKVISTNLKEKQDNVDVHLLKKISGNRFDDYRFVLGVLYESFTNQITMGRISIADKAQSNGFFLTQQEVRGILKDLNNLELIKISQGRGGTKINERGIEVYNLIKKNI